MKKKNKEQMRTVVRMRREGMKYREIAEATSLSMDTVWRYLRDYNMIGYDTDEGPLMRVSRWLGRVFRK